MISTFITTATSTRFDLVAVGDQLVISPTGSITASSDAGAFSILDQHQVLVAGNITAFTGILIDGVGGLNTISITDTGSIFAQAY
jgi:hypothetical protein